MAVIQKLRCEVENIIDHGGRVYTLLLRPERLLPRFSPGQFLHLAIDPYDPSGFWPESRVFSIASSPQQRDLLRVAFSVQGSFTARMEKEIKIGSQVWVKLPYGDFVVGGDKNVVLLAGGTGVTAFTAFIEGLGPASPHQVTLAYGARTPDLLIYRDLVEACAARAPGLKLVYFIEQPGAPSSGSFETLPGRISISALWPRLPDPAESIFYISGPPIMLKSLSAELSAFNVTPEHIRIDAW